MPFSAGGHLDLHSFPTRRSSDLPENLLQASIEQSHGSPPLNRNRESTETFDLDRKSTRLNSSHLGISYAVFCGRTFRSTLFPYTTLFRSPGKSVAGVDRSESRFSSFKP